MKKITNKSDLSILDYIKNNEKDFILIEKEHLIITAEGIDSINLSEILTGFNKQLFNEKGEEVGTVKVMVYVSLGTKELTFNISNSTFTYIYNNWDKKIQGYRLPCKPGEEDNEFIENIQEQVPYIKEFYKDYYKI